MPDSPKAETFVSTATIYKPGSGHPFPPGSPVDLHPDHAELFRKAGLEQKPEPAAKAQAPAKPLAKSE